MTSFPPFPSPFPPTHWIDDWLDYLGTHDPQLPGRLTPSSTAQIAALEQCAQAALPDPLRDWLGKVGKLDDTVFPLFPACIGAEQALEIYRDTPLAERAPGVYYIGYGRNGDYPDLGLATTNDGTFPVIVSDASQILFTLADSLPHLLYQQAFLNLELQACPVRRHYGLSRERPLRDDVMKTVVAAGLAPRNFSDAQTLCAGHSDALVALHQVAGGAGWLVVGAANESECLALAESIAEPHALPFMRQEN